MDGNDNDMDWSCNYYETTNRLDHRRWMKRTRKELEDLKDKDDEMNNASTTEHQPPFVSSKDPEFRQLIEFAKQTYRHNNKDFPDLFAMGILNVLNFIANTNRPFHTRLLQRYKLYDSTNQQKVSKIWSRYCNTQGKRWRRKQNEQKQQQLQQSTSTGTSVSSPCDTTTSPNNSNGQLAYRNLNTLNGNNTNPIQQPMNPQQMMMNPQQIVLMNNHPSFVMMANNAMRVNPMMMMSMLQQQQHHQVEHNRRQMHPRQNQINRSFQPNDDTHLMSATVPQQGKNSSHDDEQQQQQQQQQQQLSTVGNATASLLTSTSQINVAFQMNTRIAQPMTTAAPFTRRNNNNNNSGTFQETSNPFQRPSNETTEVPVTTRTVTHHSLPPDTPENRRIQGGENLPTTNIESTVDTVVNTRHEEQEEEAEERDSTTSHQQHIPDSAHPANEVATGNAVGTTTTQATQLQAVHQQHIQPREPTPSRKSPPPGYDSDKSCECVLHSQQECQDSGKSDANVVTMGRTVPAHPLVESSYRCEIADTAANVQDQYIAMGADFDDDDDGGGGNGFELDEDGEQEGIATNIETVDRWSLEANIFLLKYWRFKFHNVSIVTIKRWAHYSSAPYFVPTFDLWFMEDFASRMIFETNLLQSMKWSCESWLVPLLFKILPVVILNIKYDGYKNWMSDKIFRLDNGSIVPHSEVVLDPNTRLAYSNGQQLRVEVDPYYHHFFFVPGTNDHVLREDVQVWPSEDGIVAQNGVVARHRKTRNLLDGFEFQDEGGLTIERHRIKLDLRGDPVFENDSILYDEVNCHRHTTRPDSILLRLIQTAFLTSTSRRKIAFTRKLLFCTFVSCCKYYFHSRSGKRFRTFPGMMELLFAKPRRLVVEKVRTGDTEVAFREDRHLSGTCPADILRLVMTSSTTDDYSNDDAVDDYFTLFINHLLCREFQDDADGQEFELVNRRCQGVRAGIRIANVEDQIVLFKRRVRNKSYSLPRLPITRIDGRYVLNHTNLP